MLQSQSVDIKPNYNLTSIKTATIKKTENNKCGQGYREIATLVLCWWEYKMVQPLWKTAWQPLKIKNRIII